MTNTAATEFAAMQHLMESIMDGYVDGRLVRATRDRVSVAGLRCMVPIDLTGTHGKLAPAAWAIACDLVSREVAS